MPRKIVRYKWYIYSIMLVVGLLLNFHQHLVEAYIRFRLRNEAIVISLSTTPHRIDKIHDTLQTILVQNIKIHSIYLALPYIFKRDNLSYTIPDWLANHKHIKIIRSKDYGPATKLLGVLEQIKLPKDAILITMDDDITYPKNAALHLAFAAKRNPEMAHGISGADFIYDDNGILKDDAYGGIREVPKHSKYATILRGFAGVAYRPNFFHDDIFNIENAMEDCKRSDDLYISFYLAKHNIKRKVIRNIYIDKELIDYDNEVGLQADALHKLSPLPSFKHRSCLAFMKGADPNVIF